MLVVDFMEPVEARVKTADADHGILLEERLHAADEGTQEIGVDRGACIEKDLGIGNGNRAELVGQHAVAHHFAREPVVIQLQTGLQQGGKSRNRLGKPRIVDPAVTAVAVFPRFGAFGFRFPALLLFGFGSGRREVRFHGGEDDFVKFLRAAPFGGRNQGGVHRQLESVIPEQPVYHGIAGALPRRAVPFLSPGRMGKAQVQQLLGKVECLDVLRNIGHKPRVVKHRAPVVVCRPQGGRVLNGHPGNPVCPLREAVGQPAAQGIDVDPLVHFPASRSEDTAIIKTAISAGDTPEMRLACPKFSGRIRLSFSLASSRRPVMLS